MAPERTVPIRRSENSVLDTEFYSVREKFDNEMRKMEDEMGRFRSQLIDFERKPFSNWMDGIESPLVHEADDGKQLKLRFDVSQYAPEEIVVKTVDNRLQVHAKHEEKSECKSVYREYNREFLLPKGTNPEAIKSALSKDGVLTIEAPLPALEYNTKERRIPIDKF